MKNKLVVIQPTKKLIHPSPGFEKKLLADHHVELVGLCGFGCRYCSSNAGNFLRINRERFADATEEQLGERIYPADDPALTFLWDGVIDALKEEVKARRAPPGEDKTLVLSMLTDAFSPVVERRGITAAAFDLLMRHTRFRVRVLTKNAVVGSDEWLARFARHRDRVVVGLSIGTTDDAWARRVEIGTSTPSSRLRALARLQREGIATYGMLCPMFPDVLEDDRLDDLVDAINPARCEHVWAEPYNDRLNWRHVRAGYEVGSTGRKWLTRIYGRGDGAAWSQYATDLYVRLRDRAERDGWLRKLRFLLYERGITAADAPQWRGLRGFLLQSKPSPNGLSVNPHMAQLQQIHQT